MTVLFALIVIAHGLIHLLGFAKAFGFADLPQLHAPISRPAGILWLLAALLFVTSAVAVFVWPRGWWVIGACAVLLSTVLIVPVWSDAKFGTLANAVVLTGVAFGFLAYGPNSLRAAYERDLERSLAPVAPSVVVAEADLTPLPEPVRRYLRSARVVGRPRVHNFRVRMHGRIRSGPDARWIPMAAEQYNFAVEPARLFYLTGSMFMIPVQGYHRYVGASATMTVKAAALVPVVTASGGEMNQGETVTMFNDMCVMAPATLISSAIAWEAVDAKTARATFSNAGQIIGAELSFNEAGELVDFRSDDRYQTSPDGGSARKIRWSTPLGGYRSFGEVRIASGGEGRWHEPGGEYSYIEITFDSVDYNVGAGAVP